MEMVGDVPLIDHTFKVINEIDLTIKTKPGPTYYYYKRWLWSMFPWACIQPKDKFNYSVLIMKCYSSNIRYLSVSEDNLLTSCSYLFI